MCPSRSPSREQTSAAPRVEFTSPGTRTTSGCSSAKIGSRRSITRAVCWTCVPEPTPSVCFGVKPPSSSQEDVGHVRVVVLPGVHEHVLELIAAAVQLGDHRDGLHEVRPRAHHAEHLLPTRHDGGIYPPPARPGPVRNYSAARYEGVEAS